MHLLSFSKKSFFDAVLVVAWFLSAAAVMLRVYDLRFAPSSNQLVFWLPYTVMIAITAYMVLAKKGYLPLIFIIGMSLVIHSFDALRQPGSINWGVDSNHDLQIAKVGISSGHFVFGNSNLHSHSFDQSFYPGLEFLTSTLNLIATVPLSTLYNYTFIPLSMLTLIFFFFFMHTIAKNKVTANIAVLLYALCPLFGSFNSATLHESLSIIFFPIVIGFVLTDITDGYMSRDRKSWFIIAAISIILISITNEFSSYVLTFQIVTIVGTYFLIGIIKKAKLTRDNLYKLLLTAITLVALFSWLFFVASFYLKNHGNLIGQVFLALVTKFSPAEVVSPLSTMPVAISVLSYLGIGLLFLFSMFGAFLVLIRKMNPFIKNINAYALLVWWFISIGMMVLFILIPWSQIDAGDIRFRGMEYAYFGIVPMAAIGIQKLIPVLQARLRNLSLKTMTKYASIIVIILIAVPTISIGWPRFYYDNPPPADMNNLNTVEAYYCSNWLSTYSQAQWIAGTQDGQTWVSGNAAKLFYYAAFNDTLCTHRINSALYYINLANVEIPDQNQLSIGQENMTWLNSKLSQVYDNGKVVVLSSSDNVENN
jgi:hypothetical protein